MCPADLLHRSRGGLLSIAAAGHALSGTVSIVVTGLAGLAMLPGRRSSLAGADHSQNTIVSNGGLSGDASFRFGTAVSWLWTFDPRPTQDDWWHDVFRATGLAVGPHASILPFDPDKDVEIG